MSASALPRPKTPKSAKSTRRQIRQTVREADLYSSSSECPSLPRQRPKFRSISRERSFAAREADRVLVRTGSSAATKHKTNEVISLLITILRKRFNRLRDLGWIKIKVNTSANPKVNKFWAFIYRVYNIKHASGETT